MRTLFATRAVLFVSCLSLAAAPAARAADPVPVEGRVIAVTSPTSDSVARIRNATTKDLARHKAQQQQRSANERHDFKVVFDFNPGDHTNHSDAANYGVCRDLALLIQTLRREGVKTTAYVHGKVSGHSVLPVLSCGSLVMAHNGELGPIIKGSESPLEEDVRVAYRNFSEHQFAPALVQKMYDRNLVVAEGKQGGFVASDSPDAKPGAARFPAGDTEAYTFKEASEVGLCDLKAVDSREDLIKHLDLPRSSLNDSPLLADSVKAGHVEVTGAVNQEMFEDLQRRVQKASGDDVTLLVLELRCGKGDTRDALEIANYLRGLNKERLDRPITTVAYYTADASDTALYLALACDMFVMAPNAHLGDFRDVLVGKSPEDAQAAARGLEELARSQCYPHRLVRALIDPKIKTLYLVNTPGGGGGREFLTEEELQAERPQRPALKELKKNGDGVLTLSADEAVEYRLADSKAENLGDLYHAYGVSKVSEYGDDWINDLKNFLCHPVTSFFLVMIGITCLILELKVPGATLPGVIAAICFVLFFWSHSQLAGQITWLAILLFVLGLILLGIEIFILPGFGVCGMSGLILTFGSLALVAYGHWPRNSTEWLAFGSNVGWLGLSMLGAVATSMTLARYLPTMPIANRLFLTPQLDTQEGAQSAAPFVSPEIAGLLGAIGVTATPLRPAGKVQFGDQFIDVVTESSYVEPGTRVQVIEIEGNRVVVKQV